MRHWDYRVIRREHSGSIVHGIHEVYYDDAGRPKSWTVSPIVPLGDADVEELEWDLDHMFRATEKPVLRETMGPDGYDILVEV